MDIGLLWFDNDSNVDIEEKIRRAAQYYREKYGHPADICYANSRTLFGHADARDRFEIELDDKTLKVITASNILPHHFWVGIASSQQKGRDRRSQRGGHRQQG